MNVAEFGSPIARRIYLALGYFDGMHLGHRAIAETVRSSAEKLGCAPAISTFADSPAGKTPVYSYHDRKELYAECGMEICLTMYFSAVGRMTGGEFFRRLTETYDIAGIACGEDHTFGCDLLGVDELGKLCAEKNIPLTVVPTVYLEGVKVSSTLVKNYLLAGDVDAAKRVLVRPYHMRGPVISGDGRGRGIGVPTINIRIPTGIFAMKQGVYGTYTEVGGKRYRSVTNVGPRPTFMQNKFAVETNLIGYEGGSLLGESASVEFHRYLRPIKKYASAEELVARIRKDKEWTDL